MSAGGDNSTSDEIVISGISGRFPKSRNVREFSENLYNKVNMVDDSESKWKHFHEEVPISNGKISDCDKFDAEFFAMSSRLANCTDPQSRMLLEHSYEAILDAGVSPQSLIGSQTGVFIGCSYSDSKDQFMYKTPTKFGQGISGNANYYTANRISQIFELTGPSMTVDTACSSSAYAIDVAFKYINCGMCDAALVGGAQLVTNFQSTTEYNRLRVLSEDGICRSFDKNASGFTRADTICVIYLQKKKNSKRIYASLLNVATNNDGFKQEGSAFPSRILQQQLFEECFSKVKMDPSDFAYIEAHSTGTFVGDAEEIAAIDGAYCKKRSEPLLVGTVKSNMGHAEASSAMSATAKIILALETGKIAPNINLVEVREDIPAFSEGRIRIVTEIEDLNSPFVSLNSFGLGGANAHLLFEGNPKSKVNRGIPNDDLSRLVCWSGRTESSVNHVFDDIASRPFDAEFIALLQATQTITSSANTYRGYGIFAQDKSENCAMKVLSDVAQSTSATRTIVWVFSGIATHWQDMKSDLMMIPAFANSINRCHDTLLQKNMNLKENFMKDKLENETHNYVVVTAMEIALTDVMKAIQMQPNFLVGHSVGELAAAYADGCLTLEETILSAYALAESISEANIIRGAMAVIGLSREALLDKLPGDVDICCHSAVDSTMISGPELSVKAFVNQLSTENVFAKDVECSNVPLHSRYMKSIEELLTRKLGGIIKNRNIRSSKWLSSTYPEEDWNLEAAKTSCVAYHIKNLLNPIYEVSEKLPSNSVLIEMSPNSVLNSWKRRTLDDAVHFNLVEKDSKSGFLHLMITFGKIFGCGVDFDASKLSPPVEFPVSRNTPMIAPIIQWDHSQSMSKIEFNRCGEWFDRRSVLINISDKESSYLKGHVIDGKILLPGTAILVFVWESLSMMNNTNKEDFPVIFEEVKFLRATTLKENQDVILHISVHSGEGSFEVIEGQTLVATGIVKQCESGQLANIVQVEIDDSIKLEEKEFYKEMRLRGYHHKESFRAITEATNDGLAGKIKWNSNWTTFIDCLLQIQVLMKDTRQLVLPTKVRKLIIDPIAQRTALSKGYGGIVEVITCPYSKVIQAGGVELHEFEGTEVNRRPNPVFPVLESCKFVAHDGSFEGTNIDAAKIFVQLLMENAPTTKFTSIEVDSNDGKSCFNELIHLALEDLPTIISDLKLLTTNEYQSEHVSTDVGTLSEFNDVNFIIKSECLSDETFLLHARKALKREGFILSRETRADTLCGNNLQKLATIQTADEVLVLFKFFEGSKVSEEIIKITPRIFDWLEPLQDALKTGSVLAYSQNDDISGIIGLVNCIRRESPNLKCVFIDDSEAPTFDVDNPFYKSQLSLGLPVNVYKTGHWGTFRHLALTTTTTETPRSNHVFANCMVKGDMSSIRWFEGSLNAGDLHKDSECIRVMYSAINFRDVMQASGKIAFDFLTRIQNECVLGFEFSGVTNSGRRSVGLAVGQTFSSHFHTRDSILWTVPDSMSLAEAATIPLVYCTVYLAFFEEVSIKAGESVLIHAGSGGVGIAALHVAFRYDLEVFTTVSTQEKKNFLLNLFPKLKPENIGNSRDSTFEEMIVRRTNGRGVDYVLNSLSEEKLLASIRCLADGGTFLEIGKFDIMSKTKIDMGIIGRNINMKTVFIKAASLDDFGVRSVQDRIQEDLMNGVIQPLHTNIFPASEIQQAFRFLASGKHIGKVLVQLREKEDDMVSLPIAVSPKLFCDKACAYVIVGGLGGFGLELADWLILRGCQKLVLSSSRGVTNGYQAARIRLWEFYGVKVAVDVSSVTTRSGCEKLLCRAKSLGNVAGIFNLAVALRDGLFENQTFDMFDECFRPKAIATKNLEEISKILCPNLEHFVVFSSVSCGRGNAGQSNYGMANSIMERIIERRHRKSLPAKAIQFGAIGDVGLLADIHEKNSTMEIGGTLPQSIKSCLDSLDQLLRSEEPVVASMVVADKHNSNASQKGDIVELLCSVLGIRDKKSISMDSSLSKLGMDSLMTIEITQFLEREFNLMIPLKELQSMTLHDLQQLTKSNKSSDKVNPEDSRQLIGMQILLMNISVESKSTEKIVCLNKSSKSTQKTLIIPGIQGLSAPVWEQLSKRLEGNIYLLQWNESHGARSIKAIHDFLIQLVIELFSDGNSFNLVGYSFGSLLALEIAKTLELHMMIGKVMMIDGSPLYLKMFADSLDDSEVDDAALRKEVWASLIRVHFPDEDFDKFSKVLSNDDWDVQMENFIQQAELEKKQLDIDSVKFYMTEMFDRCKMVLAVNVSSFTCLKTSIVSLVTASEKLVDGIDVAYGLKVLCSNPILTKVVQGNHFSILNSEELYHHINQTLF